MDTGYGLRGRCELLFLHWRHVADCRVQAVAIVEPFDELEEPMYRLRLPDPGPRGKSFGALPLTRRSDRGAGSGPAYECRTVAILALGNGAVGVIQQ